MKKLLNAFVFAVAGIIYCIKNENNFKLHLLSAVFVLILGFLFSVSATEWLVLIICIAAVICLEMINTAIEKICNYIQPAINMQIKIIKDISAGAVLMAAIMAFICALIIFIPKINF